MPEITPLTRILGLIILLLMAFIGIKKISKQVMNPDIPTDVIIVLEDNCVPCHSSRETAAYNRRALEGSITDHDLADISSLHYDNLHKLDKAELQYLKDVTKEELLDNTMPQTPRIFHDDFDWTEQEMSILMQWVNSK